MTCPACQSTRWKVVNTWGNKFGVTRLRRCLNCGLRVTTDERMRTPNAIYGSKVSQEAQTS